ncbi:mating-type protein MAT alpha 1 [Aspergillus affinis]|uniref:mating-type protein MAT alpha 1 n=1 Tax=Aspergillus affinis TaxID=1070780 RepID=UPI0022FE257F|nr:mating-type protein MAT alpha 1 [Aspergillus affinis]KAI9035435.1 mating-type protein MAT alpha 1 [Aspergillus affinis]
MDAGIHPLQAAFNAFLMTIPPNHLEELLKYIRDARSPQNNQFVRRNGNNRTRSEMTSDNRRGAVVPADPEPRTQPARGRRAPEGRRRPLNSFIAFRSYYSTMFPDLTQKTKSGILRFLWQNDQFKAKWAILARAYSIVRDDHEDEVTLETFLGLNAGFIGIIPPGRYLDAMGWQLSVDDQQQYTMARVGNPNINEVDVATNYSVDDIVNNCYENDYVTAGNRRNRDGRGHAPVMAFAAQPNLIFHQNDNIQISANDTVVVDVVQSNFGTGLIPNERDEEIATDDGDLTVTSDEPIGFSMEDAVDPESINIHGAGQEPMAQPNFNLDLDDFNLPDIYEDNLFLFEPTLRGQVCPFDPAFKALQFDNLADI